MISLSKLTTASYDVSHNRISWNLMNINPNIFSSICGRVNAKGKKSKLAKIGQKLQTRFFTQGALPLMYNNSLIPALPLDPEKGFRFVISDSFVSV